MAGKMRRKRTIDADLEAVTPNDLRALVAKSPHIGARLIEAAARQGLLTAQMTYARMLLVGQDVRRDPKAAFGWFSAGAESGDLEAINMVGRCYEFGWGVPADKRHAIDTYRVAARRGYPPAQYNLAQVLLSGEPTRSQRREGLGWHLVAAKAGHAKSMNVVGRFCEEGWDMPRSTAHALGWYRKAAEGGDYWGQFNLGRLLAEEGETAEAARWFRKAADCGNDEFTDSIAPVLLGRPEEEFQAIGRMIQERRMARISRGTRAETELPRRRPRHRHPAGRGWLIRRTSGLSAS